MLQFFEYELPFRSAFQTGSATFQNRKGVLLHYQENGREFIAEASPLPGFSKEKFEEVQQALISQKDFIEQFLKADLTREKILNLQNFSALELPSVQCALSYLGLSISASRKETSVYDLFDRDRPQHILVNDVIGSGTTVELENRINQSITNGFQVLKIKAPHPVDELSRLLKSVHREHPDIRFRIDANQSWPLSEVKSNAQLLEGLPVEYIEEPCTIDDLSQVAEVSDRCSLPIALDESITSVQDLKQVLQNHPRLTVIIKPMIIGNFLEIYETISRFRSSFKQIVVTTTLESKIGRSMTALAASLFGDQQMSHGLYTGHLLADDLLPDFDVKKGSIKNLRENPALQSLSLLKTSFLKNMG